jgi:UDP-N-acetylglucosamine:LPS N-acetylglucosamine transferase
MGVAEIGITTAGAGLLLEALARRLRALLAPLSPVADP